MKVEQTIRARPICGMDVLDGGHPESREREKERE